MIQQTKSTQRDLLKKEEKEKRAKNRNMRRQN